MPGNILPIFLSYLYKMHAAHTAWGMALWGLFMTHGLQAGQNDPRPLQMSYFQADVTPPVGSPLAFGTARIIQDSLSARGIILDFDENPVVLCAVDWIGISNEGMDFFQEKLAEAVQTKKERVAVHALHQHDGVRCDLTAPRILDEYGSSEIYYDTIFLQNAIENVAASAKKALDKMQRVTHVGFGEAKVDNVASNRRILDRNGKVQAMRWNNTKNMKVRTAPEGRIDPWLKMVTLWNEDEPLVSMSYYAVHPVTYFGDGVVSPDFVGIARKSQEKKKGFPQIYFTGAAGNIGVGKYNDGTERMRYILASRMSKAMDDAFLQTSRHAIQKPEVRWKSTKVYLPLASFVQKDSLEMILSGEKHDPELPYLRAVSSLAWWFRVHHKPEVRVSALKIGDIQLLHLPGEPFVEYQLGAQDYLSDQRVCTAAYGEYGMGYIGTAAAYDQGGYETSKMASNVAPEAEQVLMDAIREVLK